MRFNVKNLWALSAVFLSVTCYGQNQSVAPEPYGVIPSARQLKWQETEMYCMISFTPTTFQNKEWGYGDANPSIFNPEKFDADQIVGAAKAAGFKGLVYVAKHHDGFALWPTKTAAYNISESPWKNGKGDMVKEFQLATKKQGMKFGIYCSPWDRNNPTYGTPEYINVYRNQLKELYSNYGELFMSWHDGANGGDGYYGGKNEKRQVDQSRYYDWYTTWEMTRKLQPDACIFSDIGLDVRWVGNEKGKAPETSWSTITINGNEGKAPMPGFMDDANLGSGTRNGKQWIPFEGDVSLRPGWFYHPDEDSQVKTTEQLFTIYCNSVGRGGCFDLGLSPTPEGLLHSNDVKALADFGKFLKQAFSYDIAKEANIKLSNVRSKQFSAANLTDADRYSYWATNDNVHQATAQLDFKKQVKFSLIQLRENIKLGQRIDSVNVEVFTAGHWKQLAKATSIGANRIIRLSQPETTTQLRIHIYAPVSIALSEIGLYLEPEVKTTTTNTTGKSYDKKDWKVLINKANHPEYAIDNQPSTVFQSETPSIDVDFGKTLSFSTVGYLPAQDNTSSAGAIQKYELWISSDAVKWTKIAAGEFANIKANPILQKVSLTNTASARYLRITAKQTVKETTAKNGFNVAEIEVYH